MANCIYGTATDQMPPSLSKEKHDFYVAVLKEELVPATGCTEPIAVSYASAVAADALGCAPTSCKAIVSGNIVKNVNSVVVPNTGGLKGIAAAVAAGTCAGDKDAKLEVLAHVDDAGRERIRAFLESGCISVELADTDEPLYIEIECHDDNGNIATAVMEKNHAHITRIMRNDEVLLDNRATETQESLDANDDLFTLADIIAFAETVDLDLLREELDRQITYNYAIAQEGLKGSWGAQIGKTYLAAYDGNDVHIRAKAAAAAGSDARMSGCPMPVIIVSGSGNQGITASVPLVIYAEEYGKSHDELLRALIVSDLVTLYQKMGIGCLSAFCGAVSAGTGATAGIAYLMGDRMEEIAHAIVNSLGIISGMICDGAKPSCAAKIAAALESGQFGYRMFKQGNQFYSGDGIVSQGVDKTIGNVSRMAREGMRHTDREILSIMLEHSQQ